MATPYFDLSFEPSRVSGENAMKAKLTPRIAQLEAVYREGLLNDVIPFWLKHGVDPKYGGIMTGVDREGRVIDTDKGVWQQGRFAWTLGFLYNHVEKNPQWLEEARRTIAFVREHCYDTDGRMFFHVTRDGRPIRKRRYAFSESFMAIACGEYARATGKDEFADLACKTYAIYGNHRDDPPKFTDTRPTRGLGHPMIDIVTCQCLRRSIGFSEADARIDRAIEEIVKFHLKPEIRCVMETVAPDGAIIDHMEQRMLNPGHAIEGAWFIMNEGKIRNRPDYIKIGLDMLDWSWERGWDSEFGGIFYFRDVYNNPVCEYWQDMKFWWPHNEAVIATLLAYQLTGDEKYARMHALVHDWTYAHFPDSELGEWYGYLARDGRICSEQKGNLFKGCFHVPRMQIECWKICAELQSETASRPVETLTVG